MTTQCAGRRRCSSPRTAWRCCPSGTGSANNVVESTRIPLTRLLKYSAGLPRQQSAISLPSTGNSGIGNQINDTGKKFCMSSHRIAFQLRINITCALAENGTTSMAQAKIIEQRKFFRQLLPFSCRSGAPTAAHIIFLLHNEAGSSVRRWRELHRCP